MSNWTPLETSFQRRQIVAWIAAEGVPVSLNRPPQRVRTNAGGLATTGAAVVLAPVQRIITTQAREQFLQDSDTTAGPRLKQYLLGTYDDDIRQGDFFTNPNNGVVYTIEYVHPDRTVETRAEMTEM